MIVPRKPSVSVDTIVIPGSLNALIDGFEFAPIEHRPVLPLR
jgi:hypothetical protein